MQQTTWNYTKLADAYVKRPDYSSKAIEKMCRLMGLNTGSIVCDVGAGVGHLTLALAEHGFNINAVEPNDAMRANGIKRTQHLKNIIWFKGTAEITQQNSNQFDAVTFGSSFNVCDQELALQEMSRIVKPKGWFACMWNHRDLNDAIQQNIEEIIKSYVKSYDYGSRRQDQTPILESSQLFGSIECIEEKVHHQQSITECVEAWRSHGTLHRQVNEDDKLFNQIIYDIENYLVSLNQPEITIPYMTKIWVAQFKKSI